jgi:hypothetical protein
MIAPVQASRLALVIGNNDYKYSPPLNSPVNDAKDMATVLRSLGFTVIDEYNLKHQDFDQAVHSFETQLHKYNVGLFYFSGHGLQAQGDNYLMPIDAQIQSAADIKYKSINANQILDKMEYANKHTNLLILDACRDNFKNIHKGIRKGLAEMTPRGSLIAFATAPGMTALDGLSTERNSIYTKHLLKQLQTQPHLSVSDLLTQVTGGVAKETHKKQWPWKSDSLTDVFCFAQTIPQKSQVEPELVPDLSSPLQPVPSYRYIDNGDGTITDNRTGLIWLKNANCFGRKNWKKAMQNAANLASGQCGLSDGSKRGMWRLPSKEEWEAMIDKKYVDRKNYSQPALSNAAGTGLWKEGDAFSGVQTDDYWSSTTSVNGTTYAWYVYLGFGGVSTDDKATTYYVWPLRGGQ